MRKRIRVFHILIPLGLVMTACGPVPPEVDLPIPTVVPTPRPLANRDRLVVGVASGPVTFDPHRVADTASLRLVELMYDTLYRVDDTPGGVTPLLVTRREISNDGRSWTLSLVTNAVFHSGRPVTARAVADSLERIRTRGVRAGEWSRVQRVAVTGPFQVRLDLSEPFAPLLTELAHPMNAVVDLPALRDTGAMDAGSGPYRLDTWTPGVSLQLRAHDRYVEPGLPRFQQVDFRILPDSQERLTAFYSGSVDLHPDVDPVDVDWMGPDRFVDLDACPGTRWMMLVLNTRTSPFDSPQVRQALARGINRGKLVKTVLEGRGTPLTGGPLPTNHWAFLDVPLSGRVAYPEARDLLARAGWTGDPVPVCLVDASSPLAVETAMQVRDALTNLAMRISVEIEPPERFTERLRGQAFNLAVMERPVSADPDSRLFDVFHSAGAHNHGGYANPRVDVLLETARQASDPDNRLSLYLELQAAIVRDAPAIFLFEDRQYAAYLNDLRGFVPHAFGSLRSLIRAGFVPQDAE